MDSCDVLIVGGGPAGSSCAWRLRDSGLDVLILDGANFPREKLCGGWITPPVLRALGIGPEYGAAGRVLQPITGFRVSVMGGPECVVSYGEPVSYGIRRCEFDDFLLRRSGARLRLGARVEDLARRNGRWVVNDAIEAPVLFGAGGHFCPVARALGAKPGAGEAAVYAREIEVEMTPGQAGACGAEGEHPELFFCRDLRGYGWCFRKGNHLNYGIGRSQSGRLVEAANEFLEFYKRLGRIPEDIPDRFRGHAYILYGQTRREILGEGALLAGDAAALASANSGEGIRQAVESGFLAAETVLAARGDYSRGRLEPYRRRLRERFGRPPSGIGWVGPVPRLLKEALAPRLFATPWFAKNILIDRWFLQRHVPDLKT